MKKYKYVLSVSMLGLCSQLSVAAVLDTPASGANLSLAIVQPSALEFLIPGNNGTSTPTAMLAFSSRESVADLKARIIEGYRLPAGIRFMVDAEEVMRDVVRPDGDLVTLSEEFKGKSGIVQIMVVLDNSRSPMHSAMPTPEPASPAVTTLELPSVSE